MTYRDFFSNKKVAIIGLGPHGEMLSDIRFLLRNKVDISVYDIRSERHLKPLLLELNNIGLDKYNVGNIDGDTLLNFDLIIISPEISKKSLFLKKAVQAEIQIEFPDTLFFKLSPPITLIGVMGLYGKSTITNIVYSILKKSFSEYKDQGIFLIDPASHGGALTHLKKIKKNDVVLARIPMELLPYYHEMRISPHVAIITTSISFDILNFQTYNNFIIAPDHVMDAIKAEKVFSSKAKMLRTRHSMIPSDWNINIKSIHDKENIALALQSVGLFKVSYEEVKSILIKLPSLKGCMEFVKKVNGVEFYNDAYSITPQSTLSAVLSLAYNKKIILIMGGAYTGHDYSDLIKAMPQYVSMLILLPGSGTLGIRFMIEKISDLKIEHSLTLDDAVRLSYKHATKGDMVLFSPSFEAVGVDISRKERSEKFIKVVRSL